MRTFLLLIAASLVLAGCTTPQQRAAQLQSEVDNMVAVYGPACSKLGYPANSDPWRNCLLTLSTKDDIQRYGTTFYGGYAGRPYWGAGGWWGPYW